MTENKLQRILKAHKAWLDGEAGGQRANLYKADLSSADLCEADLFGVNLSRANLFKANLHAANLRSADLSGADLSRAVLHEADLDGTNLRSADLRSANLRSADLSRADLSGADLSGADLSGADLSSADLHEADLSDVKINTFTIGISLACPEEGSFIGYKKAEDKIVVLEILADAKRSSATTLKCRCDKAKVLRIENLDGTPADTDFVCSDYDQNFIYKIGEIVSVEDFDEDRWHECAAGIHFFITKQLAAEYS